MSVLVDLYILPGTLLGAKERMMTYTEFGATSIPRARTKWITKQAAVRMNIIGRGYTRGSEQRSRIEEKTQDNGPSSFKTR